MSKKWLTEFSGLYSEAKTFGYLAILTNFGLFGRPHLGFYHTAPVWPSVPKLALFGPFRLWAILDLFGHFGGLEAILGLFSDIKCYRLFIQNTSQLLQNLPLTMNCKTGLTLFAQVNPA